MFAMSCTDEPCNLIAGVTGTLTFTAAREWQLWALCVFPLSSLVVESRESSGVCLFGIKEFVRLKCCISLDL